MVSQVMERFGNTRPELELNLDYTAIAKASLGGY